MDHKWKIFENGEVTGIPAQALAGSKIDFTILTKNYNNERCSKGGSHIVVLAQSSRGGLSFQYK